MEEPIFDSGPKKSLGGAVLLFLTASLFLAAIIFTVANAIALANSIARGTAMGAGAIVFAAAIYALFLYLFTALLVRFGINEVLYNRVRVYADRIVIPEPRFRAIWSFLGAVIPKRYATYVLSEIAEFRLVKGYIIGYRAADFAEDMNLEQISHKKDRLVVLMPNGDTHEVLVQNIDELKRALETFGVKLVLYRAQEPKRDWSLLLIREGELERVDEAHWTAQA